MGTEGIRGSSNSNPPPPIRPAEGKSGVGVPKKLSKNAKQEGMNLLRKSSKNRPAEVTSGRSNKLNKGGSKVKQEQTQKPRSFKKPESKPKSESKLAPYNWDQKKTEGLFAKLTRGPKPPKRPMPQKKPEATQPAATPFQKAESPKGSKRSGNVTIGKGRAHITADQSRLNKIKNAQDQLPQPPSLKLPPKSTS